MSKGDPMPARRPAQLSPGKKALDAVAVITAVAMVVTPFTAAHEGRTLTPVRPVPGDVLTVCHGETRVAMRRYTPAECTALLRKAITSDFAPPVLACVPQLADNRFAFAASVDAAYNAGPGRFCRSPMAARFRVRDWRGGWAFR